MCWLRVFEVVFLALAAGVAVLCESAARTGPYLSRFSCFTVWTILPYVGFFTVNVALRMKQRGQEFSKAACLSALCILALTLMSYVGCGSSVGSTDAIAYVFLPVWVFLVGGAVTAISTTIAWKMAPVGRPEEETRCRNCGYMLIGLRDPRCPECGEPFDPRILAGLDPEGADPPDSRR